MAPPGPVDFPPAAQLGSPGHFRMEHNLQAFAQDNNNGYRGRGQHKRCDEIVPGSSYRAEVSIAPSTVPPHAGTESRRNSRSVAPVEPVSAPSQSAFVAPLGAGSAPPAPEVQSVVYASDPIPNKLPDEPSPRSRAATQKAYARIDSSVLMPIRQLPFATDHNVAELVQFTSALRDAVSSLRTACDDPRPYVWTRGWEKCLERHVLRAVRPTSPQAPSVKSMIVDAFVQGSRLQAEGRRGPDVLQHIIRSLCRGLGRATPAAVMQALQNLVVPVGTSLRVYLSELRLSVGNIHCIGHVATDDGTMQIAIKTGVDDQFAGLSAQILRGGICVHCLLIALMS